MRKLYPARCFVILLIFCCISFGLSSSDADDKISYGFGTSSKAKGSSNKEVHSKSNFDLSPSSMASGGKKKGDENKAEDNQGKVNGAPGQTNKNSQEDSHVKVGNEEEPSDGSVPNDKIGKAVIVSNQTVLSYVDEKTSYSVSSKCPHVKCGGPPQGTVCSEWGGAPTATAYVHHSECCPIHACVRDDGSTFFHYAIVIEETPYRGSNSAPGQNEDGNQEAFSTSYNQQASYNSNNAGLQSAAASQSQNGMSPFVRRPNNAPSQFEGNNGRQYSSAGNFFYPGRTAPSQQSASASSAAAANNIRSGFFYPGVSNYQFGQEQGQGQGPAATAQHQNRFSSASSSSSSATSFSPVGLTDPGVAVDRSSRNAVASPFPSVSGQYPFQIQGSWPRFKRNIYGALPSAGVGPQEAAPPF